MTARDEVDEEDAIAIGLKIVEMADRLKDMHSVMPGATAKWPFEMDGRRFKVSMTVEDKEQV